VTKNRKRRRAIRWARFLNQQAELIGPGQTLVSGTCIRRMYDISDEGWISVRRQRRDREGITGGVQ
jgi:hypothetical protein